MVRITTNNFDFSNANMSTSNNAFGSSDFDQTINTVEPGDRAALEEALRVAGVSDGDLDNLRAAIEDDGDAPARESLGAGVTGWLREIGGKAAAASATMATTAVLTYYGLPIGG